MYSITYHPLVKKDLKSISASIQRNIFRAIQKKLTARPDVFGKPLLGELKNYYRLRAGAYRVVYRIEKERIIVFVLHIGLRKNFLAYVKSAKRLGLM